MRRIGVKGDRPQVVACAAITLVACLGALVPPTASAIPPRVPRAAQLTGLSISQGQVVRGESTHVVVDLQNPNAAPSPKRDLLIRLRRRGETKPSPIIARDKINTIAGGETATIELDATVPTQTVAGAYDLIACRAQSPRTSRCGRPRKSASLRVVDPAAFSVSPTSGEFALQTPGTTSAAKTFTVTSTGGVPTGAPAVAIAGVDAAEFAVSSNQCTAALAPGDSCEIGVTFDPASAGSKTAGLGVAATPGGSAGAQLSGSAAPPAKLAISAGSKDFGSNGTGTNSPSQTFTVTNTGGFPSGTISVDINGVNSNQFGKSSDNCSAHTLAPGDTCTADASFSPTTNGSKTASLSASATPGGATSASLLGTGVDPASLTPSPTSIAFGNVVVGQTSPVHQLTLTNTGSVPTGNLSGAITSGGDHDFFAIGASTCSGTPLNPGASCTIDFTFSPTASSPGGARAYSSSFFSDTTPGTPPGHLTVPLSGTGITPANLVITPPSKDFGNVLQGETSNATMFTVTNTGQQAATLSSISPPDRFPATTTCSATLPGGQTCAIDVRFAPNAADMGLQTGMVTLAASVGGSPSVDVSGTAVDTPANLEISITSFGDSIPGTYSSDDSFPLDFPAGGQASVKIWIHNSGAADAYVTNSSVPLSIVNATATVFATGSGGSTCKVAAAAPPATSIPFTDLLIPGGGECYIAFRRSPDAVGPYSVSFSIMAAPGGTIMGTLDGHGT